MPQRDQQPWPGHTPRRWRRAWLSRWMKGCSQLTLQDGQQDYIIMTAKRGSPCQRHLQMENASLGKPWIQLYWKTYAEPPPPLKVVVWETVDFLWVFAIFCHLYSCYIRARSKTRATKASVPSNISTGSGRALMYVCRCWNCYIHIFCCCRLLSTIESLQPVYI